MSTQITRAIESLDLRLRSIEDALLPLSDADEWRYRFRAETAARICAGFCADGNDPSMARVIRLTDELIATLDATS